VYHPGPGEKEGSNAEGPGDETKENWKKLIGS